MNKKEAISFITANLKDLSEQEINQLMNHLITIKKGEAGSTEIDFSLNAKELILLESEFKDYKDKYPLDV